MANHSRSTANHSRPAPSRGPGRAWLDALPAVAAGFVGTLAIVVGSAALWRDAPDPVGHGAAATDVDAVPDTPTPEASAVPTARPTAAATPTPLAGTVSEVFLLGDSLAVGAQPPLAALLGDAGVALRSDARTGRPTTEGAAALARADLAPDSALVVILGTNDTADRDEFVARARSVLDAVPDGVAVRWLTVARDGFEPVNDALVDLSAWYPDLVVEDWASVVVAHPEILVDDRIHYTADGYALLARFIAGDVLGVDDSGASS